MIILKPRTEEERRADVMRMRVVDDTFFDRFIEDPGACEELIQVVLGNPKLRIKEEMLAAQKTIHFVANRSVRVDAYVEDDKGVIYNIEIQRFNNCNHVKRVRYNASAITVHGAEPGDIFDNVRNVIVIYISEFDIFRLGKTIYHTRTTIQETGTVVDDGLEAIYVNTECFDNSKVSRLMRRYKEADFNDPEFPKNSARMQLIKHDEREVQYMCDIMRKAEEQARNEAVLKNSIETAKKFLALKKLSYEEIAECTGLSADDVRALATSL